MPAAEAKLPALGPAALYGEGCFETLRLDAGQPRFFEQHWARMTDGAKTLGIDPPLDENQARESLITLAKHNGVTDGVGRISLHPGPDHVDCLITAEPPRRWPLPDSFRVTISPWPHPGPSPLSGVKHNNYARFRAAHLQARKAGWDECLLTNQENRVVEGSVSNVFWVDDDEQLCTPPLADGALPGVIRALLIGLFPAIVERAPHTDQLQRAREVFLTNSLFELRPVSAIDEYLLADPPGPLTSKVFAGFQQAYPLSTQTTE